MNRRLRRYILITGTLLSLLIAVAFVVSGWRTVVFQVPMSRTAVNANAGSALFVPRNAASGQCRLTRRTESWSRTDGQHSCGSRSKFQIQAGRR